MFTWPLSRWAIMTHTQIDYCSNKIMRHTNGSIKQFYVLTTHTFPLYQPTVLTKLILQFIVLFLPYKLKRVNMLIQVWGYQTHTWLYTIYIYNFFIVVVLFLQCMIQVYCTSILVKFMFRTFKTYSKQPTNWLPVNYISDHK